MDYRLFNFILFSTLISFFDISGQNIPNVGGVLGFKYVDGNNYDFITGAPKTTNSTYLEFNLKAWNLNDSNTAKWPILTNISKSFSTEFIFIPSYQYDSHGRARPYGRGVGSPSWISFYGSFTEHNPYDWKKSQYNWPYGGSSPAQRIYFNNANLTTVALDLLEATNWKYPKVIYSSLGSIQNNLYQYTWSTHADYFREVSNSGRGSIPGRNDPIPEFYIPDNFWNSNEYAHIQVLTSSLREGNPYTDVNYIVNDQFTYGLWHTFDAFIFPFFDNGVKKTLANNSPEVYYFGVQGAYSGSEATFLSFAQDKDGDQLIYRWVDGTNIVESDEYPSNNNDLLYTFRNGYSADKPLKNNTLDSDHFYINPYSGTVNFINSTDEGHKRSFVAIDQYKDGQLIGTTINQVPFFSQLESSSNNAPLVTVSSESNDIAQKTSFDFDTDIPSSSNSLTPPTHIKPYILSTKTRLRVPYKEVNNNGEVLLEAVDAGESETVSFDIAVSDPNGDDIIFEVLPVDSDLMDTYPWTVTSINSNTYKFEWETPSNLEAETTQASKTYMFMLYAKDNNEVLPGLPGRTLKPISLTVHKRPSVVITSSDVNSGDTSNHNSINLNISLTEIDTSLLTSDSFTLTADAFNLTNATISELTKIDNSSYSVILNVASDLDPTLTAVNTSIKIDENKFSISKIGGHGINQVLLANKTSNLFEWTSDQVRPVVVFDFFDSKGDALIHNSKTNDAYIVGKISVSKPIEGFDLSDLIFNNNTNVTPSEFQKVETVGETYYTVKLNSTDDSVGNTEFTLPEDILSDNLGNQNLAGILSTDSSISDFIWEFDRIKPTLTLTNPFAGSNSATSATTGEFIFSFSESVLFDNKSFSNFTDQDKADLISVLNANTINAFFTNFIFDSTNPDQFKLTINHGGGNKTVSINIPEDFVQDLYGNNLSQEVSSTHSFTLNFPRLSNIYTLSKSRSSSDGPFTYAQGSELNHITTTDPVDILISFLGQAEDTALNQNDIGYQLQEYGLVFNIENNDINVSSGTLSNFQYFGLGSVPDDSGTIEQLFSATYTPNSSNNGFISFSIAADKFSNVLGANNILSQKQLVVDNNPPFVNFKLFTPYGTPLSKEDIINEDFLLVEAKFSEPIEDFTVEDLINGNSNLNKFPAISDFTILNDDLYSFKVTHTSGDGEYSFVNKIQSFMDEQGLKNEDFDLFNWYYENTSPTAEIEIYNGSNIIFDQEYSSNSSVTVRYVFSESGISLVNSDQELPELLNTHSDNITFTQVSFNDETQVITAQGNVSSVGPVYIELPANLFKDRGGNLNIAATDRIYFYDNSIPEPTITINDGNSVFGNNTIFNAASLEISYDFSVPLGTSNYSDYSDSELKEILSSQILNGELSNFQKIDNDTFNGTLSNFENGEIIVGFPKDLVFTDSGKKNTKANNITLYFDNIAPVATLTLNYADGEPLEEGAKINQSLVYAQVNISEPSMDLTLDDFSFSGNVNASQFFKVDDYTYSFTLNNNATGDVSIALNPVAFSDSIGNFNEEAVQFSYSFDDIRPIPSITSSILSEGAPTNATTVPIEINFSEDVYFLQAEDRLESFIGTLIENGTVSDLTKDGNTIRFNFNRVNNGVASLELPENVFNDLHTNGNTGTSFGFSFEGSIALTEVKLSSNNPLENDYMLRSNLIPGTRTLLNNGDLDYLYVNSSHEIILSIKAEAAINITSVVIDGATLSATQSGSLSEWQVVYNLSNATSEGVIDFEINYTDTSGALQTPVSITTDDIYFKKDFTPPVLTPKIILAATGNEIDYENEPLINTVYKFVLTADETLYVEKAFAQVNAFKYRGDLARFAAMIQKEHNSSELTEYHNPQTYNERPSSNLLFEYLYDQYYNSSSGFPYDSSWVYTDDYLILYPKFGSGSYNLTVPNNYFSDLAGNKTAGFTITGLTLLPEAHTGFLNADIEKKTCDYITTANVNRKLVYSANYTVESEFIVELSNDEQFSSPQVLGSHRTREISTTVNTSGYPRVAQILQKDFELDIEESKWVRFKVVDSLFHQSNDWQDEAVITYSQPVLITISPSDDILISGSDDICGLNQTENFTVNTTGGTWSVSDATIATVNSSTGELTTLESGEIDIIYTTTDGCNYIKNLEVFDSPSVTIQANGQTSFCEGTSVIITSSVSDADKIIWYKDNVAQTQLTSNTITLKNTTDSGVYHVVYVTPCGSIISNTITIKVNELPNASKIITNE